MASDFADLEFSNLTLLTSSESEMQDEDQLQNDKEDGLHFRRRYFFWWNRMVCGFSFGISCAVCRNVFKFPLSEAAETLFDYGNGKINIYTVSHFVKQNMTGMVWFLLI